RFLMTAKQEDMDKLISIFAEDEIPASYIGSVTKEKKLIIENDENQVIVELSLEDIKHVWDTRMEEEMEGKK
ncbi:MAG: hypothetical protein KAS22_11465, partial [Candidatus Heimdallarchaeota archaeon]|nr:hypothetical protein [Candidatus Heimdallarchaeota archaeon]